MKKSFLVVLSAVAISLSAFAASYDVGPGQPLASIAAVPWATLEPGDVVSIHWRPQPYKEKWVICRRGTAEKPITVRGVAGPKGELPVIDGADAVTVKGLDYTGETRSVIKVGSASNPPDCVPAHIVIQDLEVINAHPKNGYVGRKGPAKYAQPAASIWIEKGEDITVRGCSIHGSANGFFVSQASSRILVQDSRIFGNGIENDQYEHNSYTEANGMVFDHNYFGALRPGSNGSNLKDRSAGLIVRNNWIEGGARELDLVDAEDSEAIRKEPSYRQTLVYQNVLVKLLGAANSQVVHYGGDSGHADWYRNGTLYFCNNTVVSKLSGNTTIFRLMSNEDHLFARNNIFYSLAPGKALAMLDSVGTADMEADWLKSGWVKAHGALSGSLNSGPKTLDGSSPGFVDAAHDDYSLEANSPCKGHGVDYSLPGGLKFEAPIDIGSGMNRKSLAP